jgi:pfkB family carbohydrate kinase
MSDRGGPAGASRTLGVVGTLVWDTIHQRDGRAEPLEEWGGIGYALETLATVLPEGWEILPILKVGRDLSEQAFHFLRELPRVRSDPGVHVVPEPNNRVELRYSGHERTTERLSGGVPPWSWGELEPLVGACDALYVNFISGFEMDLDTARQLRAGFGGPIYADLHSLFLAVGPRGDRVPRPLPYWSEWLRCFDAVQVNEQEFELLGQAYGDPWRLAADVVATELKLIAVTLGPRGAAYVASAAFSSHPFDWEPPRRRLAATGPARSAKVDAEEAVEGEGDPTGCGDVWGASFFAGLLSGAPLDEAMRRANGMAARNVRFRGARGLGRHLAGRVDPGSVRS